MSDNLEQQADELEALISIYEGDNLFKQLNNTTFQYKYGEEEDGSCFNIEISWHEDYPTSLPKISLDTFYNRDISDAFKEKVIEILKTEGESWLGCGMTYTLFECLKEKLTELLPEVKEAKAQKVSEVSENVKTIHIAPVIKTTDDGPQQPQIKKEQLTKSQKRRMWERTDNQGNRLRGWNWVDIIKHLSQTGSKDDSPSLNSTVANVTQASSMTLQPLN